MANKFFLLYFIFASLDFIIPIFLFSDFNSFDAAKIGTI